MDRREIDARAVEFSRAAARYAQCLPEREALLVWGIVNSANAIAASALKEAGAKRGADRRDRAATVVGGARR